MVEGCGPIPNQRVNCVVMVKLSNGDTKTLYPGTYVKYVGKSYIPRYHPFEECDEAVQVAIHCPYGFALIPRHALDWNVY